MLRNLNKHQKKNKILDGVESIILEKNSTDFTMTELASYIGISPTTFYNIFGSKGAVLYSLLNRGLGRIINERGPLKDSDNPVEYAIHSMTFAADVFIEKPKLYRPLYKFQLAERDMADRAMYLDHGLKYWHRSIQGLVDCGYLKMTPEGGEFSRDDVAVTLLSHSSGVIDLWVQEDLNDQQFRARMTHDAALIILAVVPGVAHEQIKRIIQDVRPKLGKFSFIREPDK